MYEIFIQVVAWIGVAIAFLLIGWVIKIWATREKREYTIVFVSLKEKDLFKDITEYKVFAYNSYDAESEAKEKFIKQYGSLENTHMMTYVRDEFMEEIIDMVK